MFMLESLGESSQEIFLDSITKQFTVYGWRALGVSSLNWV